MDQVQLGLDGGDWISVVAARRRETRREVEKDFNDKSAEAKGATSPTESLGAHKIKGRIPSSKAAGTLRCRF